MRSPLLLHFGWLLAIACLIGLMTFYHQYQMTQLQSTFQWSNADLVLIADSNVTIDPTMTEKDMEINLFKFMSKRQCACGKSERIGNALDGGWDMCLAQPFRPKQPCLVYSFGINDDFSFDDAVAARFNCTVRSFDPSMTSNNHRRGNRIWFYKLGIGDTNGLNSLNWTLMTLPKILEISNDTNKVIDYLKIDIEDREWTSLSHIFKRGGVHSKIKQLGIEFHVIGQHTTKQLYDKYLVMKQIENHGFRRWYFSHEFRSCCHQMVYINTNFLETRQTPIEVIESPVPPQSIGSEFELDE